MNKEFENTRFEIRGDGIVATAVMNEDFAVFTGAATTSVFTKTLTGEYDQTIALLIQAVNNRTRERNYFKLYTALLQGDISEDDFDKEIEEHEEDYVVPAGNKRDKGYIESALKIAPLIKGIGSTDDFMSLFSVDDSSINKYITKYEK